MPSTSRTHYNVLNLSQKSDLTFEEVKQAYHHTLLTHHPDKVKQDFALGKAITSNATTATKPTSSIDEIVSAYTVLSDPAKRTVYDRTLKVQLATLAHHSLNTSGHAGLESHDLDDLTYSEDGQTGRGTWSRGCRCGSEQGYVVTGEDLETADRSYEHNEYNGAREILVACRGCSLLLRISFLVDNG